MDKNQNDEKNKISIKKIIKWIFLLLIAGTLATATGGIIAFTFYLKPIINSIPDVESLSEYKPSLTSYVYDRKGEVIARLFLENRVWVKLEDISPYLIKSVLAAEDAEFYEHPGLNIAAIGRALIKDILHMRIVQGGSTITQQLARNVFLSPKRTLERKIKEAILALRLERRYTKDEILEMYLNHIYWGHGAYGIYAAAKTYFGKHPRDLTLAESAMLAGIIAAPEYYSPIRHFQRAKARQRYVINRLKELGWITDDEAQIALREKLNILNIPLKKVKVNKAPYFVSFLLFKYLIPKYGSDMVYKGGLKVYTTIDMDVQQAAQDAIKTLFCQGAIVAFDPTTGALVAMVGGKDYKESKFNRAVQAYRQPGSSFKVFLYTAAIDEGWRPIDHILDEEIEFENGWAPKNYDGKFHGEVTLLEALEHSYNAAAVRLADTIGVAKIIEYARKMGITSKHLPHDLSIALGTASVTPFEMARAYCVIANGGYRVKPYFIKQIIDSDGIILEQHGPHLKRVIPETTAYVMLNMLEHVVNEGTARAARIPGYEVFGKTGTTDGWSDAWFIGGVPGLVAAVYAGYDDHKPLGNKITGGRLAAPVWKKFMVKALKYYPSPKMFPIPEGIIKVKVCAKSGLLPTPQCKKTTIVALREGNQPTEYCNIHGYTPLPTPPIIEQQPSYTPPPIKRQKQQEDEIEKRLKEILKEYGIE